MQFPLLGLARDFHPLDNAHAERTKKLVVHPIRTYNEFFITYPNLKFCTSFLFLNSSTLAIG